MLSLAWPSPASDPVWLPFLAFVVLLAVVAVWLARQSAKLVHAGEVPPPPILYANVIGTQILVIALVVVAAWLAGIPPGVFGTDVTVQNAGLGLLTGVAVFGASIVTTRLLTRVGVTYSEVLRDALEPRSGSEAMTLYGAALPAVAIGEELLFRGALVGAASAALAGFDVSPWIPAIGSSALFGYAHSAQGTAGVVVTGVLGLVLAGLFVTTESLLAVVVAHYAVNALEFAFGARLTEY